MYQKLISHRCACLNPCLPATVVAAAAPGCEHLSKSQILPHPMRDPNVVSSLIPYLDLGKYVYQTFLPMVHNLKAVTLTVTVT